jgi:outer membrane protein, adhesin transport system
MKLGTALVFLSIAVPASSPAQSLREAVGYAIQTNPDVRGAAERRLAVDEELRQARGGYLPRVDATAGYGREHSEFASTRLGAATETDLNRSESGLTLTQLLFDGFGVASEVTRQKARSDSAAHQLWSASEDVGLDAVEAYLEVLRREELVQLATDNLQAHERIYGQIKLRVESGVGRRADLEQVEGRRALARSNLVAEQGSLHDARTRYLAIIGQAPGSLARPEAPQMPASEQETVAAGLANHPALKSSQADIDAAGAQHDGARSAFWPRFDLELGATNNRNLDGVPGKNSDYTALVRLRYNLFRGGADDARVAQTGHLLREALETLERTRRQVQQNAAVSWNAYVTARERLAPLEQHVLSSDATRQAFAKQFTLGQRTLFDLLDAENEYFTARRNFVTGHYTELFGRFRVLASVGQLLAALEVPLPRESRVEPRPRNVSAIR